MSTKVLKVIGSDMMSDKRKAIFFQKARCAICKKTFYKRNVANIHRRIAVGVRPYNAKTCSKKCSRRYLYNRNT